MKAHPVVKYSEFYNISLPTDGFSLLKAYPTDLIIMRLSKINAILFNETDHTNAQQEVFRKCFPFIKNEKKEAVVNELFKKNDKEITFFTAPALLKLINLCFQNFDPLPAEERMFNTYQFEDDLFDSILIQNDLYYSSFKSDKDLNTHESIWHLQLMQQHYIRSHSDLLMIAPIKNLLFYRFMINHFPNGNQYIKEFCKSLGIEGYFNYYGLFMDILKNVFENYKEKESKHILNLSEAQMKIIEQFSIKPEYLLNGNYEGNIHKEIIPHPFYLLLNQHPLILDFHFFYHVVDIALPYNFYRFSSLKELQEFGQFKSDLGKLYYESFILRQILVNVFRRKNFSVVECSNKSSSIDFIVVRNQQEIFLIEVKSQQLHYKSFENLDISEFKSFLDQQFCSRKIEKGTRNKGVYQLAQQIQEFATTNKLNSDLTKIKENRKTTIYPIIVYIENAMDMAGVNSYLNNFFESAVDPYRSSFKKIYPLTTINLNFFIRNYNKLKSDSLLLFKSISSYVTFCSNKNREFVKNPHPMTFLEKNTSFEYHISKKLSNDDFNENLRAIVEDLELTKE